jgi:hypothetical protein
MRVHPAAFNGQTLPAYLVIMPSEPSDHLHHKSNKWASQA